MIIADEHIADFQALYKLHYGLDISKEEALEVGLRLIRLMEIVLKETTKEQNQNEITRTSVQQYCEKEY